MENTNLRKTGAKHGMLNFNTDIKLAGIIITMTQKHFSRRQQIW